MSKQQMQHTALRVPADLHRRYKIWSAESGRSFNSLIVEAMKEKIENKEQEKR